MRNTITAHYFSFGWSASMIKKTHRGLVVEFHPDRAEAANRERYTRILQDVNAESDFVKQYPGTDELGSSVYQMTGQHKYELEAANQSSQAADQDPWSDIFRQARERAEANARAAHAQQAAEDAERTRREQAAAAERERVREESRQRAERVNAERRQRAEEEAARFKAGSAPTAETPRYRVKQERMF